MDDLHLPHERLNRLPADVRTEITRAAARASVRPVELLQATNQRHIVAARVEVMRYLRKRGYSYPAIGRVFQLHHATVHRHLNASLMPRKPAPFPDESGIWAI